MMKMMIVAALSLSSAAMAKNYSSEIEAIMIEAVQEKCTISSEAEFKLENVAIKEIEVDQGIHDYVYTAQFTVSYLGKDEETLVKKQVNVRLKKYQISNPAFNPYEVLSVTSTDKRICN